MYYVCSRTCFPKAGGNQQGTQQRWTNMSEHNPAENQSTSLSSWTSRSSLQLTSYWNEYWESPWEDRGPKCCTSCCCCVTENTFFYSSSSPPHHHPESLLIGRLLLSYLFTRVVIELLIESLSPPLCTHNRINPFQGAQNSSTIQRNRRSNNSEKLRANLQDEQRGSAEIFQKCALLRLCRFTCVFICYQLISK